MHALTLASGRTSFRGRPIDQLSRKEERRLLAAWQNDRDQKAIERLLVAYRPMILNLASQRLKLLNAHESSVVSLEDLYQHAIAAFCDAALKHNRPKLRLSTYVKYQVMGELRRYVWDNVGPTRICTNFNDKKALTALGQANTHFLRTEKRPAREGDIPLIARQSGLPAEALTRMLRRVSSNDVALDEHCDADIEAYRPRQNNRRLWFADQCAVQAALTVNEDHIFETARIRRDGARAMRLLERLPAREATVLRQRILADDRPVFSDIGSEIGVTQDRARQIERQAKKLMRQYFEEDAAERLAKRTARRTSRKPYFRTTAPAKRARRAETARGAVPVTKPAAIAPLVTAAFRPIVAVEPAVHLHADHLVAVKRGTGPRRSIRIDCEAIARLLEEHVAHTVPFGRYMRVKVWETRD